MTLELREVWWCWSLTLWHIKVMVSWSVDADVLEPSSPELIAPSPPPQTEPEPMQVDAAPVANDDSVEPQRMQRKLVSKTYVNEEGYMGQYCLVSSTVAAGFAVCLSVFLPHDAVHSVDSAVDWCLFVRHTLALHQNHWALSWTFLLLYWKSRHANLPFFRQNSATSRYIPVVLCTNHQKQHISCHQIDSF